MKFQEVRSNSIPTKPYTKIIYIDFDNVSNQVLDVIKALCERERDSVLVIFAALDHRQKTVKRFVNSLDSHFYGWIFNRKSKSPDLVDCALAALQVKFMVELGSSVTESTHVLVSGDVHLSKIMANNLAFIGLRKLVIIKNETFYSKPTKVVQTSEPCESDIEFAKELRRLLIHSREKKILCSVIGQMIQPTTGKLVSALQRLSATVTKEMHPKVIVSPTIASLNHYIKTNEGATDGN